jgi:hypothetical protein
MSPPNVSNTLSLDSLGINVPCAPRPAAAGLFYRSDFAMRHLRSLP